MQKRGSQNREAMSTRRATETFDQTQIRWSQIREAMSTLRATHTFEKKKKVTKS